MSITRLSTGSDATWARAWVVTTSAERATLLATFAAPLGPKRGDMILDNQTGQLYLVTNGGAAVQITGNATLPIDLANDVSGVLPVANGGLNLSGVAQGNIPYGLNATDYTVLAKDTNATRYLSNQGTLNAPSWNQVNLANGVTGTLADGSLSSNVPLKNGTNAFTGANSFDTNPLNLLVGQLAFPATQNPSSDPNTLDDYEEGTWTPSLTGSGGASGQVYSQQTGSYTKIGRFVQLNFFITLSTLGTITGGVRINNLPFTPNAENGVPQLMVFATFNTTWVQVYSVVVPSTTQALVRGMTVAAIANVTNVIQTDLTATSTLAGGLIYAV